MKKRISLIIIILFFLGGCTLPFLKKESTYYNPGDKILLQKTTNAVGYGYGYDLEVELDYVFKNSPESVTKKNSGRQLNVVIKSIKPSEAVTFYEKIYKLKSMTLYKMNEYKADEDWKLYVHVKNYLLPPLEEYSSLLEKSVLKNVKDYRLKIEERKKTIDQQVKSELD